VKSKVPTAAGVPVSWKTPLEDEMARPGGRVPAAREAELTGREREPALRPKDWV
jgi:hypothetical protein